MGTKGSRVIEVDNIEYHLSQCQELSQKECPVYGLMHLVYYNNMEFYIAQASSKTNPSPYAIHYLVPPNLLVIPQFTLLEDATPEDLDGLLQIMLGVAGLCRNGPVGVGRGRIAFAGKWGIVGDKHPNWPYQQVLKNPDTTGVYLSSQLMLSFAQGKQYPKHNPEKSDVYALGIMILEIIFQQRLDQVFDYYECDIHLAKILDKLRHVKSEFGDALNNILLRMLEIKEQNRISFDELIEAVMDMKKPVMKLLSSNMTSSNNSIHNNSNISGRSPLRRRQTNYRNDCSPFKASFLDRGNRTPERVGRTPERARMMTQRDQQNKSPLKRDLRINTRFDKENTMMNNSSNSGYSTNRSPYKPMLLRKQGLSPISKR